MVSGQRIHTLRLSSCKQINTSRLCKLGIFQMKSPIVSPIHTRFAITCLPNENYSRKYRALFCQYLGRSSNLRLLFPNARVCLDMSKPFHTLMDHCATISNLWLCVGMIIPSFRDFVSGIHVVFYCVHCYGMYLRVLPSPPSSIFTTDIDSRHRHCHRTSRFEATRSSLLDSPRLRLCLHWNFRVRASSSRNQVLRLPVNEQTEWDALLPPQRPSAHH